MTEDGVRWDRLHGQTRFRPAYPSESVVRFLARRSGGVADHILDLGCGAGRHLGLAARSGVAIGVDVSMEGLLHAAEHLPLDAPVILSVAESGKLPFADATFDLVVAYGVLYYNDRAGYGRSVGEVRRVLRPGGWLLAVTRSTTDSRFGQGRAVDTSSFQLDTDATNEIGMTICFLDEPSVQEMFGEFSQVLVERQEFTSNGQSLLNADWVIEARR